MSATSDASGITNDISDTGDRRICKRFGMRKDATFTHKATKKRKYGEVQWIDGNNVEIEDILPIPSAKFSTAHVDAIRNICAWIVR
jgi:hypothetical protein